MPDHNNILKCLEKTLRSKKNYTALLEPRKCHNFSSIVQCLDNVLQSQLCEVKKFLNTYAVRICETYASFYS